MNWSVIDWDALAHLRQAFLDETAGHADYWRSERQLVSYDETFAQRIGWKWDYVFQELRGRGWAPPPGTVLDWGCGSGIAGRAYLSHFGLEQTTALHLWDRSALAMQFAERKARLRFPSLSVQMGDSNSIAKAPGVLLLSHVITELDSGELASLLELAGKSEAVLWIEPGTHSASRKLIDARARLHGQFHVVAPCTHGAPCGLLQESNRQHWCHHFAEPPPEVFVDGNWSRFAALAGIDLRSLPLSYLALDKRGAPQLPPNSFRVLGSPRVYKGHALMLGCAASGVAEYRLSKRFHTAFFRDLRKEKVPSTQVWEIEGTEITAAQALPAPPAS